MRKWGPRKGARKKHEISMKTECQSGRFWDAKTSKTMPCVMNSRFAAFTRFHEHWCKRDTKSHHKSFKILPWGAHRRISSILGRLLRRLIFHEFSISKKFSKNKKKSGPGATRALQTAILGRPGGMCGSAGGELKGGVDRTWHRIGKEFRRRIWKDIWERYFAEMEFVLWHATPWSPTRGAADLIAYAHSARPKFYVCWFGGVWGRDPESMQNQGSEKWCKNGATMTNNGVNNGAKIAPNPTKSIQNLVQIDKNDLWWFLGSWGSRLDFGRSRWISVNKIIRCFVSLKILEGLFRGWNFVRVPKL